VTRSLTTFHGLVLAALLALVLGGGSAAAQTRLTTPVLRTGPQGPEGAPWRRQAWLLPGPANRVLMRATLFRPPGPGPFPLVVVNHGSSQDMAERAAQPTPLYLHLAAFFVARNHAVVVPQRPGHGATGGPYLESQGGCDTADYRAAGLATAESIAAAIDYMTHQPFIRRDGVIVVGQSAGAWGALALASSNPAGLRAAINFAGGRGGRSLEQPNRNCAPDRLVATAAEFGRTARVPTLWLYAENDTYFGPDLSRRMAAAFRLAGGRVDYRLLPAHGEEGHRLVEASDAVGLWAPLVDAFLKNLR